jgi:threonine/homoserine/homoserine lactone efflux protein
VAAAAARSTTAVLPKRCAAATIAGPPHEGPNAVPIDPQLFQLYLVAAAVLVLIPGPDTLLVLGRSLFEGRRAGWTATAGTATGNVVHAGLAAAGVSALVAAAPALFEGLRLAGAGYLAWLGLRSLRAAHRAWRVGTAAGTPIPSEPLANARRVFGHALTTNLLNAKVILFYLAFVPQFVAPALGSVALQTFLLGLALTAMGALYHLTLAALAAGAAGRVTGSRAFRVALEGVSGLLFLGFAVRLFFTERRFA